MSRRALLLGSLSLLVSSSAFAAAGPPATPPPGVLDTMVEPLPRGMSVEEWSRFEAVKARPIDLPITALTEAPLGIMGMTPGGEFEHVDAVALGWANYGPDINLTFKELAVALDGRAEAYFVVSPSFEAGARAELLSVGIDVDSPSTTVKVFVAPIDTVWLRDYGPIWVKNPLGRSIMVNPYYYWFPTTARPNDDDVPYYLSAKLDLPISSPEHNLEGGNFQANGQGLCVMSNWAVDENAGFGLDEADIRNLFITYYGCEDVLIVPEMAREGTGHVDMWLAFVDEDTALVGEYEPGLDDENMNILNSNAALMDGYALPAGGTLEVVRIPMPDGDCLCGNGTMNCCVWRTYTNTIYVDDAVLVPTYTTDPTSDDPADIAREAAALTVWATVQPDRDIVGINSADLIYLAGSIHCISQTWSYGESLAADSPECLNGTATHCAGPETVLAEVEEVPPLEVGCAIVAPGASRAPTGLVLLAGLTLAGAIALRSGRRRDR